MTTPDSSRSTARPGLTSRELDELHADAVHAWRFPATPPEAWLDG